MRKKFNILVICIVSLLCITTFQKAEAVTANPNPIQYKQPDGSIITLQMKGDEFIHWATTIDGYMVMSSKTGFYEYAIKLSDGRVGFSGIQAHDPDQRTSAEMVFVGSIMPGLFFSSDQIQELKQYLSENRSPALPSVGGFPTTGVRAHLLILANFNNTSTTYTQANFNNLLNQVNYNGTGSFRDYYLEVSYGQLTVNTTVTVWVTLPQTHDYYGPQSMWGTFAYDAVVAANNQAGVNYALYDNDSDGIVDGVCIAHQGRGQEESGSTTDIWSHSWDLASAGYTAAQRTFDGVQVLDYTTIPEKGSSTTMTSIGVMCHEFGHNLGAPDFYDTDYSGNGQYDGTGSWDIMANGSWNGSPPGSRPAHHNPWTKNFYNWLSPTILTTQQSVLARNILNYPDVFRYNTTTTNEYFLCENRQQTGFNSSIPGHGMLIYHVDGNYISAHMNTNDINCTSHQGMYPMSATSTTANGIMLSSVSTINSGGCPWPGTSNKTTFTDATTPNSKSWAGTNTAKPLISISENTTTKEITFCFIACSSLNDPATFTATAVSSSQINLAWTKNGNNDPVMVAYSLTGTFGTPATGTTYSAGNTISGGGTVLYNGTNTTYNHTSLTPNTTYYYKAWSVMTGTTYSPGITANAHTFCGAITSFPWNEGFENAGVIPTCWTQEQVNGSGINWTFITGSGNGHPAAAHGGTYNACLKDVTAADNKTRLITPTLNLTSVSSPQLKFWHTQALWGTDQDQLIVFYKNSAGGAWTQLAAYTANITAWTQETISLPNATSDYYIAFEGNAKWGYGVCLDDVSISSSCASYLPVSVSIAASANPACAGTSVTFTPTPVNGGTPTYQWYKNTVAVATGSAYSYVPVTGDQVYVIMTSSLTCTTGSPATSNTVTMTVNPVLPVSVSIAASANPVCSGTSVTFTPTPINGGAPTYQWYKNTVASGTGSAYSCVPVNGDQVYVIMTSSLTCKSGSPATSNTVNMTVYAPLTANFIADKLTPPKNETVLFTDLTTGGATAWNWSFDRPGVIFVNGTNASSQNPQVQFTDGGLYQVTLVATHLPCSDSEIKSGYLRAGIFGKWTGNTSSDWNTLSNWDNYLVPDGNIDVVIPPSAAFWPVFVGDFILGTNGRNLILSGTTSQITITGNLVIQ